MKKYNNDILNMILENYNKFNSSNTLTIKDLPENFVLMAKKGSKIYIKPENRGKFNATKKRTGKSTEELTHSKNPVTRKRAIFALNSRKWNKGKK